MSWAVPNGPLTIENPEGSIHLALFESDAPESISAVAFGASASEFIAWKDHLESHSLDLRLTDHSLAYSLYFADPWGNLFEITTYERDAVAGAAGVVCLNQNSKAEIAKRSWQRSRRSPLSMTNA